MLLWPMNFPRGTQLNISSRKSPTASAMSWDLGAIRLRNKAVYSDHLRYAVGTIHFIKSFHALQLLTPTGWLFRSVTFPKTWPRWPPHSNHVFGLTDRKSQGFSDLSLNSHPIKRKLAKMVSFWIRMLGKRPFRSAGLQRDPHQVFDSKTSN